MKRKILFGLAIILLAITPIITNTAIAEEVHTSGLQKDSINEAMTKQEVKGKYEKKTKKAQVKKVLVPSKIADFEVDYPNLAEKAVHVKES